MLPSYCKWVCPNLWHHNNNRLSCNYEFSSRQNEGSPPEGAVTHTPFHHYYLEPGLEHSHCGYTVYVDCIVKCVCVCVQSVQQQSWSEGEGADAADGSSEGEEGESIGEEEEGKVKGEKVGSKRKKTASLKVWPDTSPLFLLTFTI